MILTVGQVWLISIVLTNNRRVEGKMNKAFNLEGENYSSFTHD